MYMKKWFLLLPFLMTSLLPLISRAQDSDVHVKSSPFPSNWRQMKDLGGVEIFPLTDGTSWTPLSQDQKPSSSPAMEDYGIYNDIIHTWLQTNPKFSFQLVDPTSQNTNPLTIEAINKNDGNPLFTKNNLGQYECFIPVQVKTSDYVRLHFVSDSLNYCGEQYQQVQQEAKEALLEKSANNKPKINPACFTSNKPLPNVNGGLPGRRMEDPMPMISCGYPVGSPEASDVQIPLGQPFPNDPIQVGMTSGRDFQNLQQFCGNLDCTLNGPISVPNVKIPSNWKENDDSQPFQKQ